MKIQISWDKEKQLWSRIRSSLMHEGKRVWVEVVVLWPALQLIKGRIIAYNLPARLRAGYQAFSAEGATPTVTTRKSSS